MGSGEEGNGLSDVETKPMPLVSVVIAVFNTQAHIEETCQSVLRQTYAHLELIVVDDGSTDATACIVERLAATDPRVRLIRQPNRGVAAARNRGIEAASGEFIAPLDADDLWRPTKIERQVAAIRGRPEVGMVYCWWAWIDLDGVVLDRSPRWQIEGQVLVKLVEVNFTGSASVPLFRRARVLEVGPYDVTLRDRGSQGCEDWDLAIRIAEKYAVAVVPSVLVGYRRRKDSMSAECDTMWRSQLAIMAALTKRQPSLSLRVLRRSSGQFALHLAGISFWSGNHLKACLWAIRARPLTLGLAVIPHVARLLVRRLLPSRRPPLNIAWQDDTVAESKFPEPLIPYDLIYGRYWQGDRR